MLRFLFILFILSAVAAGGFAYDMHHYIHSPIGESGEPTTFVVDSGAAFNKVNQQLHNSEIIRKPFYFKLLAMYEEQTHNIKSGEYRFHYDDTPEKILENLVTGKTIQHSLTIIEGKTFKDFHALIQAHPKIKQTIESPDQVREMLSIEQEHLEGLFLPETYQFTAGTEDVEIFRQSHLLLRQLLDEEWPQRDASSYVSSPYEALILASIVEKETAVPEERERIAGVFISRLQKGMKLQTDPTVIYGIGASFDGNITRKHLREDTPYNTYVRYGLPPTPIALASKASLMAVLHPDITGELFFVSKGDGTHYFSKTYAEHSKAVREYQLKKK